MNIQMGYSNMRSEPSEYMWKTRVILIHLVSYFGNCVQEFWDRNWMNLDESTMLFGEITGSVPETSLDWESILKERTGFWEGHSGKYPLKIGC